MLDTLKIGHITDLRRETGVTVLLFDKVTACSVFVAGSAPATRDIELLKPTGFVPGVNAISLSGGSAFGLGVADGVMQWLKERNQGLPTLHGVVPIVPGASIYDFSSTSNQAPTAQMGYQACEQASIGNFATGRIGAATAATVGKLIPQYQTSLGGFGTAYFSDNTGLEILACAVVNAVGDIINEQGQVIAGARNKKNEYVNLQQAVWQGEKIVTDLQTNTTLVTVVCNGQFDKPALARIAKMASAGMARAIVPCFTLFDGDIIFAAATQAIAVDETRVSMLAAELVRQAIVKAVSR